jgi:hypothetical protein
MIRLNSFERLAVMPFETKAEALTVGILVLVALLATDTCTLIMQAVRLIS